MTITDLFGYRLRSKNLRDERGEYEDVCPRSQCGRAMVARIEGHVRLIACACGYEARESGESFRVDEHERNGRGTLAIWKDGAILPAACNKPKFGN